MKTTKANTAVMVVAVLAAGLVGCSTLADSTGYIPGEGTRCGKSLATGAVYIDVKYAPDGTPLDPGECHVAPGTDVTWQGPEGEPVMFEIRFKATAPLESGERGILPSAESGGRYKVMRKIAGPPGRYDYGIKANGKELDPAIIIR